jgi:hypothetical protein
MMHVQVSLLIPAPDKSGEKGERHVKVSMDTCVRSGCISDGCRTANHNFVDRQRSAFGSRKAGTGTRLVLFGRAFVLRQTSRSITQS